MFGIKCCVGNEKSLDGLTDVRLIGLLFGLIYQQWNLNTGASNTNEIMYLSAVYTNNNGMGATASFLLADYFSR